MYENSLADHSIKLLYNSILPAHLTRGLRLDREDYKSFLSQLVVFNLIMKLDTKALRYLTPEDWRVLTAVLFLPNYFQ